MTPAGRARRCAPLVLLAAALLASACAPGPSAPGSTAPGPTAGAPIAANASAVTARALPTGAIASVDPAAWALADRLTAPAYTSDTTAALVAGLARSGIGTYADTTSATPDVALTALASPFELLDFQAHALAVGAWTGATWSGAELDGVVPVPTDGTGLAPTSALLAGYVGAVDSPGAALSRALMAGQDLLHPATLRFPAVVLVLFASDLATGGGQVAAPSPSPSAAALATSRLLAFAGSAPGEGQAMPGIALNSICSDTANWVQGMIDSLFNALKLATPTNVVGAIFSSIWNFVVDKLQAFVQGLISSLTDALLGTIKSVAGMISAVAEQIASLVPYGVRVTALGGTTGATFFLGPNPQRGEYTADVTAADLPAWPAVLSDCASVAKVDLPNFAAKAVPVTFGPLEPALDPLIVPTDAAQTTTVTDSTGLADWPFLASRDPGDPTGEQRNQFDYMPVAVHRPELDRLRAALSNALFGFVPGLLRPFVDALFAPYLDGLQGRLNALLDARGRGAAVLVFHDKVPPTPSPSAKPSSSSACATSLPAGTYTGTFSLDSTTTVPSFAPGGAGLTTDHGSGPLTISVGADGSLTGTFSETTTSDSVQTTLGDKAEEVSTTVVTGNTVSGSICQMVLAFGTATVTACHATGRFGSCDVGGSVSLAGHALPMGAPVAGGGGALTWTRHDDNTVQNTAPGLVDSVTVVGTTTVTISAP